MRVKYINIDNNTCKNTVFPVAFTPKSNKKLKENN